MITASSLVQASRAVRESHACNGTSKHLIFIQPFIFFLQKMTSIVCYFLLLAVSKSPVPKRVHKSISPDEFASSIHPSKLLWIGLRSKIVNIISIFTWTQNQILYKYVKGECHKNLDHMHTDLLFVKWPSEIFLTNCQRLLVRTF